MPLAQRRHLDGEHVQAVVQILAEAPAGDRVLEIAVGGGDDAHVAGHGHVVADALEHALLQDPQQLHLHGDAHVADLVEEQRAALGDLEAPLARGDGTGERALLVTEQLGLEQVGGNRAAVDRDERAVAARAELMNGARGDFLAGAGFAEQQNGGVVRRDLADEGGDAADGERVAAQHARGTRWRGRYVECRCAGERTRECFCRDHSYYHLSL